jgi:hypothetical protein
MIATACLDLVCRSHRQSSRSPSGAHESRIGGGGAPARRSRLTTLRVAQLLPAKPHQSVSTGMRSPTSLSRKVSPVFGSNQRMVSTALPWLAPPRSRENQWAREAAQAIGLSPALPAVKGTATSPSGPFWIGCASSAPAGVAVTQAASMIIAMHRRLRGAAAFSGRRTGTKRPEEGAAERRERG